MMSSPHPLSTDSLSNDTKRSPVSRRHALALLGAGIVGGTISPADAQDQRPIPLDAIHLAPRGTSSVSFRALGRNGDVFDLTSRRGKASVVHFWGTWCVACLPELPKLAAFVRTLGDDSRIVTPVAVASGPSERVATWLGSHGDTALMPYAMTEQDIRTAGMAELVSAFPSTLFIDGSGYVRATVSGEIAWDAPGSRHAFDTLIKRLAQT